MRFDRSWRFLAVCAALILAGAAHATDLYVATCGDDSWTGLSAVCEAPDGPKASVEAAVKVADDGDVINIAPGIYNEDFVIDNKSITLRGTLENPAAVRLQFLRFGSFSVVGAGSNDAVIEGLSFRVVASGFNVINTTPVFRSCMWLDGQFSPTLNVAQGAFPAFHDCEFINNSGSAFVKPFDPVRVDDSAALFVGCNFAKNSGGGAFGVFDSTVVLMDCTFSDNSSTTSGVSGGSAHLRADESLVMATNCLFEQSLGRGVECNSSTFVATDCIFADNFGDSIDDGGAIQSFASVIDLDGCVFNNNSGAEAGAIWIRNGALNINNCVFEDNCNFSRGGSGAIFDDSFQTAMPAVIHNSRFGFNESDGLGVISMGNRPLVLTNSVIHDSPGLHIAKGSSAEVFNCTFTDNPEATAMILNEGDVLVRNSILWNVGTGGAFSNPDDADVQYSDVQGGLVGRGNIDADPLFVNPLAGDFNLQPGSPCIDAGLNGIDMGAFPFNDAKLSDFDDNGIVDGADLLILLNAWGRPGPTDLDNSGTTGGSDLLILLNSWG